MPLPSTPEEKQAEHEKLKQQATAESRATGIAEWELRIELASHHDAHALAETLAAEGFTNIIRRWKFLIVGTADEDDADTLAERLKGELPPAARSISSQAADWRGSSPRRTHSPSSAAWAAAADRWSLLCRSGSR